MPPTRAPGRRCGPRSARDRSWQTRRRRAVGHREGVDDRRPVPAPLGAGGSDGAVHPGDVRCQRRDARGVRAGCQHLDRGQGARADPGALERSQADTGVAALAQRVDVGLPGLEAGRGDHQCGQDDGRAEGGEPAAVHHQPRPARPGTARLVIVADVRPVEPVAGFGEHDREQRQGDDHADQRNQHPGIADRAQERQREHDHRQQPDRHRGPLKATARPAVCIARTTASSPSWPCARSSRQRTTTSRE